jgi:hypothetical protein
LLLGQFCWAVVHSGDSLSSCGDSLVPRLGIRADILHSTGRAHKSTSAPAPPGRPTPYLLIFILDRVWDAVDWQGWVNKTSQIRLSKEFSSAAKDGSSLQRGLCTKRSQGCRRWAGAEGADSRVPEARMVAARQRFYSSPVKSDPLSLRGIY